MKIEVEGAVKTVDFSEIPTGEFFSPFPNCVYLKIDMISTDTYYINAINMDGGGLACFRCDEKVYPLNTKISAEFAYYDFSIETNC